jgi:hypothetical protein
MKTIKFQLFNSANSLFIAFLFMVFLPKEALVSKLFYDTIPLDKLVEQSELIVVAKSIEPFQKTEHRTIKKGPPFSWFVYQFKISEIIYQDSSSIKTDSKISVSSFDDNDFKYHKKYYETGLSVIRHVSQYKSAFQPLDFVNESKANGVILFLISEPNKSNVFRFTKPCSYESIKKLSETKKLVKNIDREAHW